MKALIVFILITGTCWAKVEDKEYFRLILQQSLQKDPAFKEIDLQTPLYEAQLKQGFSRLVLPKVNLSYGQYYQNNQPNIVADDKYRIGSLNATFDVFSFGSDWKTFQSTRYEVKAQDQRVLATLLKREADLAAFILEYLKEARNNSILQKLLELKSRALDVSRARYKRGSLSKEDFSKVKLDLSNVKAELLVSQQSLNIAMARVKAFGIEELPSHYPWENELNTAKIQALQRLSTPVSKLPQFRSADLAEVASNYRREAYRNLMFGKFQLNFSRYRYDFQETNLWGWQTSLIYTIPLFDSFDQYTEYKRIDVQQRQNAIRTQFAKNQAAANQEAESSNLDIAWKNWMERREALKTSASLYQGSLAQFNQGKLSVNELFVDQDRLLRTEIIANLSLHQLHSSVLAFCHSRGMAYVQGCF